MLLQWQASFVEARTFHPKEVLPFPAQSFYRKCLEADHDRIVKTKIVIAGGRFAGLYAAEYFDKRLARRDAVEITLISRENFILFTPMLHEIAAESALDTSAHDRRQLVHETTNLRGSS